MVCEKCKSANVYVIDSRERKNIRRRRYNCDDCGARFSTLEGYETAAFFFDGKWGSLGMIDTLSMQLEESAEALAMLANMLGCRRRSKEKEVD